MDRFENKIIKGVHTSRYIASWSRVGGDIQDRDAMKAWLLSEGLTEEEADDIVYLASNGRLELQASAKQFLKNYKESEE